MDLVKGPERNSETLETISPTALAETPGDHPLDLPPELSVRGSSVVVSSSARHSNADSGSFSLNHWLDHFVRETIRLSHKPGAGKSILRMLPLILLPFSVSFRAMGYRWASNNGTPEFSLFLPSMFGAIIGAGLGCLLLLAKFGVDSTRRLFHKQYVLVCGIGVLRGIMFACENVALANVDSLIFIVTMKFAIVPCLCMEALAIKACPIDALQILTIINTLLGIWLFLISSSSDGVESSILGIGFSMVASILDALADVSMGNVSGRLMAPENEGAERFRCIVVMEFSKALMLTILSMTFEARVLLDKGILHGFDYKVWIGAVLGPELKTILGNVMVIVIGAVPANLAGTWDIAVTYMFKVVVFRTEDFGATALLLAMITCSILAYFVHMILLVKSQEAALKEVRGRMSSVLSQDSFLERRLSQQSRRLSQQSTAQS
ncbi:unnamed protein product [Prorocentrum cordatum]|uniref:Uncharacterized protein n=1 Tax=Prorocentrum cordatum TaxID=2364126 RepID=A0ABN9RKF7_9DINO|nr:unnamed protein product [Polarella glacialis]